MNSDTNSPNKKKFSLNPLRLFRGSGQLNQITQDEPIEVLTGIIASLQQGGQINVAANDISIPGPINNAKGAPIIFKANGQTYFAYSQEKPIVYTQKSAADIAGSMAIVKAGANEINTPTTLAYLNKVGEMINENEVAVGYSVGGDSSGKVPAAPSPAAVNSEINTLQQERQLMGNAISDAPKPVNFPPTSNYAVHNQTESTSTISETKGYVSGEQLNTRQSEDSSTSAGWVSSKPEQSAPVAETSSNLNKENINPHIHPFGKNPF